MLEGLRRNNLCYYQGSTAVGTVVAATSSIKKEAEAALWHMWLGHVEKSCKIKFCEHCVPGKQRKVKFGTAIPRVF